MTQRSYPTRLRDHLGNEIKLPAKPFATGGEGAVFDVVDRPNFVAKLYSKPQSQERCDKLRAMAKLCSNDLLTIAAWPTATLSNGNPAVVEGILMPKIVGYKEIHELYSVAQRKKNYPEVDWGFLLHTARNCASAFENVHAHGHVVGDVNQKNVMVSKKGIVALVDCDSFQVKEGKRIFRCGVGVPEYTPPELHGCKFTDLDREPNHDLFGLAVMVFHLLMMGRHPYSGSPQVNYDIPIEKAIQEGLYAYSLRASKLKPPPLVPPLTMLSDSTRELFERAFCSRNRPTATEWRQSLDASMRGLQRCKNDSKHSYAAGNSCPWCQIIAISRVMFFIPSQGTGTSTLQIEDIRNLIQKLTSLQLTFPSYTRPKPRFPIQVRLPVGLQNIQKPVLKSPASPPAPLAKPELLPEPQQPAALPRPILRPLPSAPDLPPAPVLKWHPFPPAELPRPILHALPPRPTYPPFPTTVTLDPFLTKLSVVGALAGIPVLLIAKPVAVIIIVAFTAWWLFLWSSKGIRREIALNTLKQEHHIKCVELDNNYQLQIQPIEQANKQIIDAWNTANAAKLAEHSRVCKAIDKQNQITLAPWEAAKRKIEAEHHRITMELQQINNRILSDWEKEKEIRYTAYIQECQKIQSENQRRIAAWNALTAARQMEHRKQCAAIDAENAQTIARWEAQNAPWITEQKRWRDLIPYLELEIKRLEDELTGQRNLSIAKFQRRKSEIENVLKNFDGARQDFERELKQAEIDSKELQLMEYLDKALIRHAKLKGITGERLLSLESFGIETAKDIAILYNQKVPGIGPVLTKRLYDWRYKLSKSFQPKNGLPDSERKRIASRYAPILLPLKQTLQSRIIELEEISASHLKQESERTNLIEMRVQDLAKAEAHFHAMKTA